MGTGEIMSLSQIHDNRNYFYHDIYKSIFLLSNIRRDMWQALSSKTCTYPFFKDSPSLCLTQHPCKVDTKLQIRGVLTCLCLLQKRTKKEEERERSWNTNGGKEAHISIELNSTCIISDMTQCSLDSWKRPRYLTHGIWQNFSIHSF